MNLVRHDLGFSKTEKRFPDQGHVPCDLFARGERRSPLEEVLGALFPWCAVWQDELRELFGAYVEAKQRQQRARLRRSPALLGADDGGAGDRATRSADRFDHVLVDEYQDTNRLQASILLALKPNGKGLTVVGDDAQSIYSFRAATVRNILDFPGHFSPPARSRHARAELSLDAADPRCRQCGDRARRRALHQEPLVGARLRRAPAARHACATRPTRRATSSSGPGEPRGRASR